MSEAPSTPGTDAPRPVRTVICDDHDMIRAAFALILRSHDIEVVGEAGDGAAVMAVVDRERPDVVLMDARMPLVDGVTATEAIASQYPSTRVLMLTTFDDDEVLFGALSAGASGFLLKNSSPEELVAAIRRVAAGDSVLDPTVTARVVARFTAGTRRSDLDRERLERLTERERDVLWLMARGMTNSEVADTLSIGDATTKTHVSRVLAKLSVKHRVQAVIYAFHSGFATSDRSLG